MSLVDKNMEALPLAEDSGKKKVKRGEWKIIVAERIAKWKELNEGRINANRKGKTPFKMIESKKGCRKGKGGPENGFCSFKGVRQMISEKWVAEITMPNTGGKCLWLGTFETPIKAALSYDAAARELYGPYVDKRLNIPGYTVSASPSMEEEYKSKPSSSSQPTSMEWLNL